MKINKGFAQYIKTKQSSSSSPMSNHAYESLMSMSKQDLYAMAQEKKISGRSKMTKEQLAESLV